MACPGSRRCVAARTRGPVEWRVKRDGPRGTLTGMSDITVLTLVPNAGDRLPRCLESVRWADNLFCVVDPKTSDGSDDVARRYTDRVVVHTYENAAAQRNWAIPQITTEWTLVLDADEWVSPELAERIRAIMAAPDSRDGYDIRRLSYFFGKLIRHCGWHRDYNLRLFRTRRGRYLDKREIGSASCRERV